MRNIRLLIAAVSISLGAAGAVLGDTESFSKPSEDFTLAFVRSGLITSLSVKEGDVVKKGQVLAQLDDTAEQESLAQLKAQAEDTIRVQAAEAELQQKEVDLKKFEEASAKGAATKLEVEHARLDVTIARLTLDLAKFQHEQDIRKHKEAQLQIDRMRIVSPVDGKIERLFVRPGNTVDALEKVIRLVKIDPLWIDAPVSRDDVRLMKLCGGGKATVEFLSDSGLQVTGTSEGTIAHVGCVADPGSSTLTVRVEVPNTGLRPAGEQVRVRFAADTRSAGTATQPANQTVSKN